MIDTIDRSWFCGFVKTSTQQMRMFRDIALESRHKASKKWIHRGEKNEGVGSGPGCCVRCWCPGRWWPRPTGRRRAISGGCGRWPRAASRRRWVSGRARRPPCRSRQWSHRSGRGCRPLAPLPPPRRRWRPLGRKGCCTWVTKMLKHFFSFQIELDHCLEWPFLLLQLLAQSWFEWTLIKIGWNWE